MDPKNEKTKKRQCIDTDSDPDTARLSQTTKQQSYPTFIIIESKDNNKTIASLSPFIIEKQILGLIGNPKQVKKLKSGSLLVEVTKQSQSKILLKTTKFFQIPVNCYPHKSLNTSRGLIRCPDLRGVSDEEITTELKDQNVTAARRIKIKKDEQLIPTNTIILTFGTSILPKSLKIGYLITPVQVYIPNPMICHKCQKFGHTETRCNSAKTICNNCGSDHDFDSVHCETVIKNTVKCANCSGPHRSFSKDCPKWKLEKEVLTIKYQQNITFPEARKIADTKFKIPSTSQSYASISKTVHSKSVTMVDAGTQTATISTQTETITTKQTNKSTNKTDRQKQSTGCDSGSRTRDGHSRASGDSRGATVGPSVANGDYRVVTNTKGARSAPKPRIQLSDRASKGSNDPVQNFNRFGALSDDDDSMDVETLAKRSQSSSPKKNNRIKKIVSSQDNKT